MALTVEKRLKIVQEVLNQQRTDGLNFDNLSLNDLIESINNLDSYINRNAIAINNEFSQKAKGQLSVSAKNTMFRGLLREKFG